MFCRSLLRLYGPTACIVAVAAGAAADVPAPPAPPAPPTPTRHAPQHTQEGQTGPSRAYLRDDVQYFTGWESPARHSVPPAPPSPQAQLPAVPESRCHRGCGWLGSDAFAGGATDEALPECHPLPCLIEVRWRNEPVTPEFAAAPCAPAASECRRLPEICLPENVRNLPPALAPVRTARHVSGHRPVAHVVPSVSASAEASRPLTPLQHLLRAADHLEAAGRGEAAEQLRRESAEMQRRAGQRLQELLENKRLIEQEIGELQRLTGALDQVQIRVSILEVDEPKLLDAKIGFKMPAARASATGAPLSPAEQPVIAFDLRPAALAANQLRALRECEAAKVLAEPVLVTTDGREATVFSGGEIPILVPQEDGSILVEHKECGVRLTATPQLLDNGRLRLDIASEVSERDFRNVQVFDGHEVPGITARRFNAQVVMRLGETLVIGGLSRRHEPPSSVAQMLKKIPYQNQLFRPVSDTAGAGGSSRSLVVFVTAESAAGAVHSAESAPRH